MKKKNKKQFFFQKLKTEKYCKEIEKSLKQKKKN